MPSHALERTFVINPDVLFRDLDGEAVLLEPDSGTYFGLNAVGTRIWRLLVEQGRLALVLDALVREYDAPADRLEEDLLHLVRRLSDASLGHLQ
jgi:Coenzyme PQQ synthesis protein D (PqqD)